MKVFRLFQSSDITKGEIRFVAVVSILALTLTLIPFLMGHLFTPEGGEYTWIIPYSNILDINCYLSWRLHPETKEFLG